MDVRGRFNIVHLNTCSIVLERIQNCSVNIRMASHIQLASASVLYSSIRLSSCTTNVFVGNVRNLNLFILNIYATRRADI